VQITRLALITPISFSKYNGVSKCLKLKINQIKTKTNKKDKASDPNNSAKKYHQNFTLKRMISQVKVPSILTFKLIELQLFKKLPGEFQIE
jgi:hypothetical protein